MWGLATTCGNCCSAWSVVGSEVYTSRAAPPIWPALMASTSAGSSIKSPRAVLMILRPFLHFAKRAAPKICRVCDVDGMCSER